VSDHTGSAADRAIAFGAFRLLPARHLLLEGEKPLRLGSRALDILIALVERPGDLITKEELVARVWPNTFVEEGNLRVHLAALRKALGDGQAGNRYVATIPGRGYRFVAPISLSELPTASARAAAPETAHNLPALLTRPVGRAETVSLLVAQVQERRFITVAGPGGIGKTTVALAVADELSTRFKDSVRLVDLASVSNPDLVPSALASVLGVAIRSGDLVSGLIAFLRDKEMLLVLDSCEHVIEAAAELSEAILNRASGVHILATSREPLRAEGERVQRLLPLGVPASSSRLTAADALEFPAIQLFVERATANAEEFKLNDADAPIVADICRRLDGMALAIELAAGCVDAFGIAGVAARLNDRFRLLTRGRRTALPRHQTLGATLDWSYQLLPESERVVLRRLAVFAGRFTLEAASAITSDSGVAVSDLVDQVANLVAKSLIAADVGGATVHYRLLESTQAYARDRLAETDELQSFSRRHAEYFWNLFRRAEAEWDKRPSSEWLDAYGSQIDNVRAALDWAFSPVGDPTIGVGLTTVAVPLWLQLSLMDECRKHVERALAIAQSEAGRDPRLEMQLSAALGSTLVYTSMGPNARAAWTNALEIAERLDDVDYKLRTLWGLWVDSLNSGRFQEALSLARRFYSTAARSVDPIDPAMGDRMIGISLHFIGEQPDARSHIERMLSRYVTPTHAAHIVRFQFDQRLTARSFQARILWLLGFPDQAADIAEQTIEDALSTGHVLTLCNALGQGACPIALLTGNLAAADRFGGMLLDQTARHGIALWHAWGLCFNGVVAVRRGDATGGLRALRSILNEVPEIRLLPRYLLLLGELAMAMGRAGEIPQALRIIEGALDRAEHQQERWCIAELLRLKGELMLLGAAVNSREVAEGYFRSSLDWTRRQSTLSWELRTATSLARLCRDEGRAGEGRNLLASAHGRFSEGFGTTDLKVARELLAELS
jgi:predicted ATPase/DNA-binding winged helix-turn-helix (wHTH) protein